MWILCHHLIILCHCSQDAESVSKVLWQDEIQQAIHEANLDEERAKQCEYLPSLLLLAS